MLNLFGVDKGCLHPTGTSPAQSEGSHPELHQTSPTCTLSLTQLGWMGSVPLSKFRGIISDPSLVWTLPLCFPSLADMGAEVYYSPGVLLVNTSSIMAVFDGAIAVSISAASGILSVVCSLPDRYRNSTKGLLGEDFWHHCRARVQSPLPTLKQAGKHRERACEGRGPWV